MAKEYQTRPSDLLGIGDPFIAIQVDSATWFLASYIKGAVEETKGKNEKLTRSLQENRVRRILGLPPKFADPRMKRG